jgi:hypothetical protein
LLLEKDPGVETHPSAVRGFLKDPSPSEHGGFWCLRVYSTLAAKLYNISFLILIFIMKLMVGIQFGA